MSSIELTQFAGGASGMAIAAGMWVFVVWCWMTGGQDRGRVVSAGGLMAAGGVGASVLSGWLVGGFGLSSLGAIAGGTAVGLALVGPFRFVDSGDLDCLIPAGVAGLSVARLGCLVEGCDFGRIGEVGPTVVYGSGSRAWEYHVAEYGLSPMSSTSMAVYPFAGYLAIWGLGCAVFGQWWRRRGAADGKAAVVSGVAFLIGGGAIEWLREPATVVNIVDGVSVYPLIYWLAAVAAVVGSRWSKFGSGVSP